MLLRTLEKSLKISVVKLVKLKVAQTLNIIRVKKRLRKNN